MKKIVLASLLMLAIAGSVSAQDTVRYLDDWYLFHRYHEYTILDRPFGCWDTSPGNLIASWMCNNLFSRYVSEDRTTMVYGIAVTAHALPDHANEWSPSFYLYEAMSEDDPTLFTITDSADLDGPRINRYFEYRCEGSAPGSYIAPCIEFYFDHPHPISLQDSFYISHYWSVERMLAYDSLVTVPPFANAYSLYCGITPVNQEWYYSCYSWGRDSIRELPLVTELYGLANGWGKFFPIVGLRCAAPRPSIANQETGAATVRWTQAEAGLEYQLSYAPYGADPSAGTIVQTADTFYTITELEEGAMESVWVRKSCRYTTAGYDTIVWSDWSSPYVFRTLDIGEVESDGLKVRAEGGRIVVEGAEGMEVKIYDMKGIPVGDRDLPAGVYMVRIGTLPVRKVVLR